MSTEEKSRYFQELTLNLQRKGLTVKPETEGGLLPVELDGQRLCLVLDTGGIRYWKKDVAGDIRSAALDRVIDIAKATVEYMSQMEAAPQLKASDLEGDYRLLADFNSTVLAGHPTKYGVQFITWERSSDRTSLEHGHYYGAHLFGASVLYSVQPIPREDVPQGWYCYDLRGTARHSDEPYALVDQTEDCHAGSVLSYLPLKSGRSQKRLVKNMFQMLGTNPTLAEFCTAEKICCPETPLRHMLCPASPEDAGLFYAQPPERDEELGAIGHLRIDFGSSRKAFHHSWWPRGPEELNTQEFRDELDRVVNDLRKSVLKDLSSMRRYCYGSEGAIEGGSCCQNYGFTLETDRYLYRLRCNPTEDDYQAYLGCFIKQEQQLGLTEKGCQTLQNAADTGRAHSYSWYVIENINDPEHQIMHELPLEDAIQLYASLDCEDKRLGVTKDDIAAVDLVIRWEGCEWLSKDCLTMDSFKDDPVVADAVDQLQQTLKVKPLVGRVTFAGGERCYFTDPQKYLQTVCEELPYQATTGFRCETLTDAPAIRKAVDDMLCDLYGEENSRQIEDYSGAGMTMGGMI